MRRLQRLLQARNYKQANLSMCTGWWKLSNVTKRPKPVPILSTEKMSSRWNESKSHVYYKLNIVFDSYWIHVSIIDHLAIREDGMPGGRNKYTGPVNYSPEEVGGILNGSFYNQLTLPSSSPPSSTSPSSASSSSKPGSLVDHASRMKSILQTALDTPRSQKRRRSMASDQTGMI